MEPTVITVLISFATGCVFTAVLACALGRRIQANVTVNVPEVELPDTLTAIVKQPAPPAPPPVPMDRATLWKAIHAKTLEEATCGDDSYASDSDMRAAVDAANQAVDKAFPAVSA